MSHKKFDKQLKKYIRELRRTIALDNASEVTVPDHGLRIRKALVKKGFDILYRDTGPQSTVNLITIS